MTLTSTPARREGLTGGAAVTLIAEGMAVPAGLVTAMVLTRGLGPEIYGRFTVVATTVAMAEWLLIALFAPAVVKFVAQAEDWQPVAGSAFRAYVLSGLALAGAFWLAADLVAGVLDNAALAGDFRLFVGQIPVFAAGAACRNILAGRGRYRQQALASATGWLARAIFIVVFIELQFGLPGAIAGSVCGTCLGAAMAVVFVGRAATGRGGLPVRQLMQLALPVFLGLICGRVLERLGLFVLQARGTEEAVGYYGAALNVMQVSGVIAAGVAPVLISTLTEAAHRGDRVRVRSVCMGAMRFAIALFPMAAIAAGASEELVGLLFGPAFSAAAPLLSLLVMAAVALAMVNLMGAVLIALDRAWVAAWIVLVVSAGALAAHLTLVPVYGALGAALTTVAAGLGAGVVSVWVVRAAASASFPVLTLARSVAISAVAYAIAIGWATAGPMTLVKIAILAAAAAAAFGLSGELTREEWTVLRSLLSRRAAGSDRVAP